MNTISYKGYLGTVNFSEKDACFYGKIEGIDGLVNFEGESVHGYILRSEGNGRVKTFAEAVVTVARKSGYQIHIYKVKTH